MKPPSFPSLPPLSHLLLKFGNHLLPHSRRRFSHSGCRYSQAHTSPSLSPSCISQTRAAMTSAEQPDGWGDLSRSRFIRFEGVAARSCFHVLLPLSFSFVQLFFWYWIFFTSTTSVDREIHRRGRNLNQWSRGSGGCSVGATERSDCESAIKSDGCEMFMHGA